MKKRATRHRDTPSSLAIRKQYRRENPECELSQYGIVRDMSGGAEIHHIVGAAGRIDVVSNLITLSPVLHRWVEANVVEGRIWCLYAKWRKQEINAEEFRQCSGYHLSGWLLQHRAEWPVCLVPYLDELVKSLE